MLNIYSLIIFLFFNSTLFHHQLPVDPVLKHNQVAGHRILRIWDSLDNRLLSINTITQDSEGRYWIARSGGITMYDEKRNAWKTFESDTLDILGHYVKFIDQSKDNRLWFVVVDNQRMINGLRQGLVLDLSLGYFDGKSWARVTQKDSVFSGIIELERSSDVSVMFEGKDGMLWFVLGQWLVGFDGRNSNIWRIPEDGTYKSGLQDNEGYVWLGRSSQGVLRLNVGTGELKTYNPMKNNLRLQGDAFDGARKMRVTGINTIYEDRRGRLWFAAGDGNVYVYNKQNDSWNSYRLDSYAPAIMDIPTTTPDIPRVILYAMYQDDKGQMMFATDRGLICFREGRNDWEVVNLRNNGLPAGIVTSIMEDKTGRIWLGTSRGIVVLEQ